MGTDPNMEPLQPVSAPPLGAVELPAPARTPSPRCSPAPAATATPPSTREASPSPSPKVERQKLIPMTSSKRARSMPPRLKARKLNRVSNAEDLRLREERNRNSREKINRLRNAAFKVNRRPTAKSPDGRGRLRSVAESGRRKVQEELTYLCDDSLSLLNERFGPIRSHRLRPCATGPLDLVSTTEAGKLRQHENFMMGNRGPSL